MTRIPHESASLLHSEGFAFRHESRDYDDKLAARTKGVVNPEFDKRVTAWLEENARRNRMTSVTEQLAHALEVARGIGISEGDLVGVELSEEMRHLRVNYHRFRATFPNAKPTACSGGLLFFGEVIGDVAFLAQKQVDLERLAGAA